MSAAAESLGRIGYGDWFMYLVGGAALYSPRLRGMSSTARGRPPPVAGATMPRSVIAGADRGAKSERLAAVPRT